MLLSRAGAPDLTRRRSRLIMALFGAVSLMLLACTASDGEPTVAPPASATATATPPTPSSSVLALSVSGNQLVDGAGRPFRLAGVNRSGTESGCSRGTGFFDADNDTADAALIASWGANAVRVPLNEHCWLGRNGAPETLSGDAYQAAIRAWVDEILEEGLVAVLALSWSGAGADLAAGGDRMPNADHSLDFWASVAETFADSPGVVFDAYSSPNGIDWDCWRDGCELDGVSYVGMQQVVDTIRGWGATQPLVLSGIDFAADLGAWLDHVPEDSADAIVAGFQSYSFGKCTDLGCWRSELDPVLRVYPMVVTELAEDGCDGAHVDPFIDWTDARGVSWLAWTFNAWGDCSLSTLIEAEDGTPTILGVIVKGRLASSALDPIVSVPPATPTPVASGSVPHVRVEGNRLVNEAGSQLQLRGVNRAGTEYACAQGWGIFDVNGDAAVAQAIASWGANAVRVSLNEHCWLGRNGVVEGLGGEAYQDAIAEWVGHLHDAGLVAILTLHWAGFGDDVALFQERMANEEHSLDFWASVGERFRDQPGILFQLYAEPHEIGWDCWQFGCELDGYQTASMQQLLDALRSSGAEQPAIVSGINFAADLSEWLERAPVDPVDQLVAGFHTYNFSGCNEQSCWDDTIAPLAEVVPVVTAELGESTCNGSYVNPYIDWAREREISWIAWTFNAWATCANDIALVLDEQGTPTPLGEIIRARLMEVE